MGTLMTLIFTIRCRHTSMPPLEISENPRNQSNLCSNLNAQQKYTDNADLTDER
ncbi:MAG: hypothetical protein RIC19_15335 [Phaeodactylibacter sp.]|uniref:hypothetical protein n=1 Tax=Phaeodactylibacter sp. TaxID=1940289 RepID=UPI0032EEC08E